MTKVVVVGLALADESDEIFATTEVESGTNVA